MVKATMVKNATPTDELLNKTLQEVSVVDARGRVIKLKKPNILAQYDLIELLGESAKNEIYRAMVLPAIYVTAIDNHAVYPPTTKLELRAIIQRLDEDGLRAVSDGVNENFADKEEDVKESLKK
jgi:hypothetical protein